MSALSEARRLLESLSPKTSTDPATVSLLGDIELSLFEAGLGNYHLLNARQAFERLYANRPDWHRGARLAYLVVQGAARQPDPEERNADLVIARRLWRDVVELGKNRLAEINALRQVDRYLPDAPDPAERAQEETRVLAAMGEAHFGLGEFEKYENTRTQVVWAPTGGENLKSLDARIQVLRSLMRRQAPLTPAGGVPAAEATEASDAPAAEPASRAVRRSSSPPGGTRARPS